MPHTPIKFMTQEAFDSNWSKVKDSCAGRGITQNDILALTHERHGGHMLTSPTNHLGRVVRWILYLPRGDDSTLGRLITFIKTNETWANTNPEVLDLLNSIEGKSIVQRCSDRTKSQFNDLLREIGDNYFDQQAHHTPDTIFYCEDGHIAVNIGLISRDHSRTVYKQDTFNRIRATPAEIAEKNREKYPSLEKAFDFPSSSKATVRIYLKYLERRQHLDLNTLKRQDLIKLYRLGYEMDDKRLKRLLRQTILRSVSPCWLLTHIGSEEAQNSSSIYHHLVQDAQHHIATKFILLMAMDPDFKYLLDKDLILLNQIDPNFQELLLKSEMEQRDRRSENEDTRVYKIFGTKYGDLLKEALEVAQRIDRRSTKDGGDPLDPIAHVEHFVSCAKKTQKENLQRARELSDMTYGALIEHEKTNKLILWSLREDVDELFGAFRKHYGTIKEVRKKHSRSPSIYLYWIAPTLKRICQFLEKSPKNDDSDGSHELLQYFFESFTPPSIEAKLPTTVGKSSPRRRAEKTKSPKKEMRWTWRSESIDHELYDAAASILQRLNQYEWEHRGADLSVLKEKIMDYAFTREIDMLGNWMELKIAILDIKSRYNCHNHPEMWSILTDLEKKEGLIPIIKEYNTKYFNNAKGPTRVVNNSSYANTNRTSVPTILYDAVASLLQTLNQYEYEHPGTDLSELKVEIRKYAFIRKRDMVWSGMMLKNAIGRVQNRYDCNDHHKMWSILADIINNEGLIPLVEKCNIKHFHKGTEPTSGVGNFSFTNTWSSQSSNQYVPPPKVWSPPRMEYDSHVCCNGDRITFSYPSVF